MLLVTLLLAGTSGVAAQSSDILQLLPAEGTCSLAWAAATAQVDTVRSAQRPLAAGAAERAVPFSCGTVEVSVPLDVAQRVVRALDEMDDYVPRLAVSERLGQQATADDSTSEGPIRRYRQVLALPFPARDRDYQIDVTEGWLVTAEAEPSSADDDPAPRVWWTQWRLVPGSGNMLRNRGAWILEQLGERRIRILYLVDSDPGGGVPAWLVRRLGQPGLRDALSAVANRMRETALAAP